MLPLCDDFIISKSITMKISPLSYLISQLKSIESHVVTTDNVIHMAESLLQLERDCMAEIGDKYVTYLNGLGIQVESGKDTVNRIYGKLK
jgi:hypothetical protein